METYTNGGKCMLTVAWVDVESTGLDPRDSGAFEIALLIYQGKNRVFENLYHLNPLDDEVKWSEEAFKVNGVSEETILSYPPLAGVVPDIVTDLKKFMPPEKYVFAGYKCDFDYGHIGALFFRGGFAASDYFNERLIDVYELVKRAADAGLLPKTPNQKLETIVKLLNIDHGTAHTAMDDINATRKVYEAVWNLQQGAKP
jgi:DNA polymerase III epsilon subunit-like protein